jgi:hypothetical protein
MVSSPISLRRSARHSPSLAPVVAATIEAAKALLSFQLTEKTADASELVNTPFLYLLLKILLDRKPG